jgi:hypothetical protein
MQIFENWFEQDLAQPIVTRHCESVMFTADNLATVIGVRLYRDCQPAFPGTSCVCTVIRSDGASVTFPGEIDGNAVTATLPQSAVVVPGPIAVLLQSVSGDTRATVLKATFTVEPSTTDTIVDPGSVVPNVAQLLALVDEVEAAGADATAAAASADAAIAVLRSVCPAITVGPAALVSASDALAMTPDALTLTLPLTQNLHGYDAPWPGGAAPGILYGDEVSLTQPENTLPLTLESGTYTLWAQAVSTNPDTGAMYQIKAYPSVTTGTYQEIELDVDSSAPVTGRGTASGAVSGIVLEGGITGHEYPPTVRVMVLSGDVALANIPPWENICPITGRTSAIVNHGASADDPDAQTYAFSFPAAAGTVYAGTLNALTGILTVTHAALVVDGSTLAFYLGSDGTQYRVMTDAMKLGIQGTRAISNWLPSTVLRINSNVGFLYGYVSDHAALGFDSAEALNAKCAETPLVVVYELASPVPYQLTPAQITMLTGANTIWTDDGTLSLTYRANPYERLLALIRSYHPETTDELAEDDDA